MKSNKKVKKTKQAGKLPGHPIGEGPRRVWRFRLSELAAGFVARPPVVFTSTVTHSIKLVKTVPGATE